MKTLLICPAIRPAVPHLAEDCPLATVPILGENLVRHWIEHLVMHGARSVQVIAADRAGQVRASLGDGARWGVRLEVIAASSEPTPVEAAARHRPPGESGWLPAPHDIVSLDHLPGCPELPLFESYASWHAALLAWMPRALTPARVRVSEVRPGIWISRRAHVSPNAELIPPCWIGDQVAVESGAIVGPGAIVEDRSVVEGKALITQSWIGPDTFVGPVTSVASSLAWGSNLINWRTDSSLLVPDPFLLSSLVSSPAAPQRRPYGLPAGTPVRTAGSALNWIPAWPEPTRGAQDSTPPA